ncbi:hypothetical protein EY643_05665 [Halioglobus maricola]|uniref:Uncharacterized protein n=1 Tax=Halioglobus maricola TaxID=2601894 RepID=A0A5P9NJN2_9GAMM|nr:hypothetical protein [Halioglobus maricola]QFU75178.1 hypothetical protein EY643_05665 [Halioglobus maricola]
MTQGTLIQEELHTRLVATFPEAEAASAARVALGRQFNLDLARMSLLTPDQAGLITQGSKFDHGPSGRVLQRRQLKFTFIAFGLMLVGMLVLHILAEVGVITEAQVTVGLGVLITAAIVLTVHGLLSWQHVRILGNARAGIEEGALLLIDLHDISESYEICQALDDMGVNVFTSSIGGHE